MKSAWWLAGVTIFLMVTMPGLEAFRLIRLPLLASGQLPGNLRACPRPVRFTQPLLMTSSPMLSSCCASARARPVQFAVEGFARAKQIVVRVALSFCLVLGALGLLRPVAVGAATLSGGALSEEPMAKLWQAAPDTATFMAHGKCSHNAVAYAVLLLYIT